MQVSMKEKNVLAFYELNQLNLIHLNGFQTWIWFVVFFFEENDKLLILKLIQVSVHHLFPAKCEVWSMLFSSSSSPNDLTFEKQMCYVEREWILFWIDLNLDPGGNAPELQFELLNSSLRTWALYLLKSNLICQL